jgi:DNA-binding transcriptional LysR family regulator
VGAPAYLKRTGTPKSIEDLLEHECIQFEMPSTGRPVPWLFMQNGEPVEITTQGGYGTSGDALAGIPLACHGAGLFQTYRFTVENELRAGTLTEVLREFGGCSRPFILLYPHGRHLSSRVRAFVDFVVERLAKR